jgi:hypothetical protein
MASGHVNRENRPNPWLHPTGICDVKIILANSEPSTHVPSRKWHFAKMISGIPSKADLRVSNRRPLNAFPNGQSRESLLLLTRTCATGSSPAGAARQRRRHSETTCLSNAGFWG